MIYKLQIEKRFDLTAKEISLLKRLRDFSQAEYRDHDFNNYKDYLDYCTLENLEAMTRERFDKRNFGDTYSQAIHLEGLELLEEVSDTWHPTFMITNLGKLFLEQNNL